MRFFRSPVLYVISRLLLCFSHRGANLTKSTEQPNKESTTTKVGLPERALLSCAPL